MTNVAPQEFTLRTTICKQKSNEGPWTMVHGDAVVHPTYEMGPHRPPLNIVELEAAHTIAVAV